MAAEMSFIYESARRRLTRIVELLQAAPEGLTHAQPAKATHISPGALYAYLSALLGADSRPRQIRIGKWIRQLGKQGNPSAIYFAGEAEDEPRPPRLTNAERVRRHRVKVKEEKQHE